MSEFLSNLSSFYWWLSVVFVGILINLGSSYLKNRLDAQLSRLSSRWRERSEVRKAQRMKTLEGLRDNYPEQVFLAFSEIRYRIRSVMSIAFVSAFCVLALYFDQLRPSNSASADLVWMALGVILLPVAAVAAFMGFLQHKAAMQTRRLLEDSRNSLDT